MFWSFPGLFPDSTLDGLTFDGSTVPPGIGVEVSLITGAVPVSLGDFTWTSRL